VQSYENWLRFDNSILLYSILYMYSDHVTIRDYGL